jgi:glutamyl-tRNA reductase
MVSVGVLGVSHKTADLSLREAIARGAQTLSGEKALFFSHPIVLLSTCNRTEIYFSAPDLGQAHSDLLAYLRLKVSEPFENRLYSYFGVDCFSHLCRVAAGLDSAVLAETDIQRQVRQAYAQSRNLPSCMHYIFQKTLKVSKEIRNRMTIQQGAPTLYGTLWSLADWEKSQILLVGYSELNRGLISFLKHRGMKGMTLCTQNPSRIQIDQVKVVSREVLENWQDYDLIVCASKAEKYLIGGKCDRKVVIFDLSVPRNVDPTTQAIVYNIEQINQMIAAKQIGHTLEEREAYIRDYVLKLIRIYRFKTQHVLETVEMGSHL